MSALTDVQREALQYDLKALRALQGKHAANITVMQQAITAELAQMERERAMIAFLENKGREDA